MFIFKNNASTGLQNVMLRNHGKRPATFELCINGFFVVTPRTGTVDPGNFLEVYIQFRPPLVGTHEGELIASYNNNAERMYCKLLGIGLEVNCLSPVEVYNCQMDLKIFSNKLRLNKLTDSYFEDNVITIELYHELQHKN